MKKTLSIVAILAGLSFSAVAQEVKEVKKREVRQEVRNRKQVRDFKKKDRSPEEIAKLKIERLDKVLKFTEKQKEEVYALELGKAKNRFAKREAMRIEMENQRKEMKENREAFDKILTPEQKELMKKEFAENRRDRLNKGEEKFKHREFRRKRMHDKVSPEKLDTPIKENSSNS